MEAHGLLMPVPVHFCKEAPDGAGVPLMASWPTLAQTPVYILLGIVWLLPLKRFLIWMETGRWR